MILCVPCVSRDIPVQHLESFLHLQVVESAEDYLCGPHHRRDIALRWGLVNILEERAYKTQTVCPNLGQMFVVRFCYATYNLNLKYCS